MAGIYALGFLLLFSGLFVLVLLFWADVVKPALRRSQRRQALRDKLEEDLNEVLYQQQITAAGQAWEDLQRQRERLEKGLDDLHKK